MAYPSDLSEEARVRVFGFPLKTSFQGGIGRVPLSVQKGAAWLRVQGASLFGFVVVRRSSFASSCGHEDCWSSLALKHKTVEPPKP